MDLLRFLSSKAIQDDNGQDFVADVIGIVREEETPLKENLMTKVP